MTSRRIFLRNSALAMVGIGPAPSWLERALCAADAPSPRKKILVAIFQRGAADGLNVVVPHGEKAYYALRPTIAIPRPGSGPEGAIDLDGFFGLHPSLAPLKPLYEQKHLAIVDAAGSPDPTRSHFDAQDYMESGTPGRKATTARLDESCASEAGGQAVAGAGRCGRCGAAASDGRTESGDLATDHRRVPGPRRDGCKAVPGDVPGQPGPHVTGGRP